MCPIAESTKHSQGLDIDQSGISQWHKIFLDGIIVAHSEMIVIANSLAVVKLDELCNAIELVMRCYCFSLFRKRIVIVMTRESTYLLKYLCASA